MDKCHVSDSQGVKAHLMCYVQRGVLQIGNNGERKFYQNTQMFFYLFEEFFGRVPTFTGHSCL